MTLVTRRGCYLAEALRAAIFTRHFAALISVNVDAGAANSRARDDELSETVNAIIFVTAEEWQFILYYRELENCRRIEVHLQIQYANYNLYWRQNDSIATCNLGVQLVVKGNNFLFILLERCAF